MQMCNASNVSVRIPLCLEAALTCGASNILTLAGFQTFWMRSGICTTMRTQLVMPCLRAGSKWISITECDSVSLVLHLLHAHGTPMDPL